MHQRFAMTVADNHVITVSQLLSTLQVPDQNFSPFKLLHLRRIHGGYRKRHPAPKLTEVQGDAGDIDSDMMVSLANPGRIG